MQNSTEKARALRELLSERILVLDGAMGTMLQQRHLTAADFGGASLEGCNENLVRTRPDVVLDIHRAYLNAGSDIIETNTFGGTPLVLAEYGLASEARELNKTAAQLARQAADAASTPAKPRFVAGSMGPTTKAITVMGGVTFEELRESYYEQARGLVEGGADLLFVETCQDTRNIKAAILAIHRLSREIGAEIPFLVSATVEPMGTMLAGQNVEAMWASLRHARPLAFGLNCATGPEFMTDHIRTLSQLTSEFVSCYPNAGLPDEEGKYLETPTSLAAQLEKFAEHGWLNLVGGCCGTTEKHIRAIAQMAEGKKPRTRPLRQRHGDSRLALLGADGRAPRGRPHLPRGDARAERAAARAVGHVSGRVLVRRFRVDPQPGRPRAGLQPRPAEHRAQGRSALRAPRRVVPVWPRAVAQGQELMPQARRSTRLADGAACPSS